MLLPHDATAQVAGVWSAAPTCYKALMVPNFIGGTNLAAPCCNCGCRYVGFYCIYMTDCGILGVACDIQFGCLNQICAEGDNMFWNAIWDGPYEGEIPVDATSYSVPTYSFACGCDKL